MKKSKGLRPGHDVRTPRVEVPRRAETEEIVRAIREGEVDALVVMDAAREKIVSLTDCVALAEVCETLRAIRQGEVDALVISEGGSERIITLAAAERALNEDEGRFRELAESMPCVVITADASGHVNYVNRAGRELAGRDLNADAPDFCDFFQPADRPELHRQWQAKIAAGQRFELETQLITSSGKLRWYAIQAAPTCGADGRIHRWLNFCVDIDRMKRAQDELDRHRADLQKLADARLQQLNESQRQLRLSERMAVLGTLSSGIGHDMGNLFIPLKAHLDVLSQAELPHSAAEHVQALQVCADHLQRLIRGMRAFAADPFKAPRHVHCDLNRWWSEAQPLLSIILSRNIELRHDFDSELPAAAISESALTQIVFNLVQNAVQVLRGRKGGVIEVSARRTSDRENGLTIVVRDNGPGMDEATKTRCFEPFFTTKTGTNATGLGLALVKQIVNQVGGRIDLQSELNVGTQFTLHVQTSSRERKPLIENAAAI